MKFGEIIQNIERKKHLAIMPFKVTTVGTNRKPICHFLRVNNTNLHPILHCFQNMVYWTNFQLMDNTSVADH